MTPFLLAAMGPTAAGKTALAEAIADATDARLINADAFQAYRGFDIGTGKPDDRGRYDLLDFKAPEEPYGVGEFIARALPLLEQAFAEGRNVIVVGGTGLYVRALFEEYADMAAPPDPELRARLAREPLEALVDRLRHEAPEVADRTDLLNPVRVTRALERLASPPREPFRLPPFRIRKIALDPADLRERIERRVAAMFAAGWTAEVARLVSEGVSLDAPAFRAIGYREIAESLVDPNPSEAREELVRSLTVRYAKRQRTWLRTEPRLLSYPDGETARDATLDWIRTR